MLLRIKTWLRMRRDARWRGYHAHGYECPACAAQVGSSGRAVVYRSVRSVLFFCHYDLPERADKLRRIAL